MLAHLLAARRFQCKMSQAQQNGQRRPQLVAGNLDEGPMHLMGPAIWTPIGTEGMTQTMMYGDGYGLSRSDLYSTSLMDFHRGWRRQADSLSETTKLFTLLGTYIREYYGSRYYGKATNLARQLTAAYDAALASHNPYVAGPVQFTARTTTTEVELHAALLGRQIFAAFFGILNDAVGSAEHAEHVLHGGAETLEHSREVELVCEGERGFFED